MLVVIDRRNLQTVFIEHYDTNIQNSTAESTSFTNFTSYTYDEASGNVQAEISQTKTISQDIRYKPAAELSEKIKEYNEKYIIVLLSCDSWELNFSTELATTLENYGAVVVG